MSKNEDDEYAIIINTGKEEYQWNGKAPVLAIIFGFLLFVLWLGVLLGERLNR